MLEKKNQNVPWYLHLCTCDHPQIKPGNPGHKIAIYTFASFPCHRRGQLNEQESRHFQQTFASQKAKVHSQLATVEGKGALIRDTF